MRTVNARALANVEPLVGPGEPVRHLRARPEQPEPDHHVAEKRGTTSNPLFAAGTLPSHPTYHIEGFSRPSITSAQVVRETAVYCAFAVDTSQNSATTPTLTLVRQ